MYKKKEETKPVKIQASAFTLEDHKKQLTAWIEAEHIPKVRKNYSKSKSRSGKWTFPKSSP